MGFLGQAENRSLCRALADAQQRRYLGPGVP